MSVEACQDQDIPIPVTSSVRLRGEGVRKLHGVCLGWYSNAQKADLEDAQKADLEDMLVEYEDGSNESEGWPRPTFGPTTPEKLAQIGPSRQHSGKRRIS